MFLIMMNKRGLEMAISTIILIIIGIAVLIGLLLLSTKGFGFLKKGTEPLLKSSSTGIVKQACEIACTGEDANTFCCEAFVIDKKTVYCKNGTFNLDCSYDCSNVVCS